MATNTTKIPTLVDQVRQAYADALLESHAHGVSPDDRCLDFVMSEWVTVSEAVSLLRGLENYNAFDPIEVSHRLALLERQGVAMCVVIARESSPALYVATETPEPVQLMFMGYADENGLAGGESLLTAGERFGYESHSTCRHDHPPVPDDRRARADPEDTLVRLWFD